MLKGRQVTLFVATALSVGAMLAGCGGSAPAIAPSDSNTFSFEYGGVEYRIVGRRTQEGVSNYLLRWSGQTVSLRAADFNRDGVLDSLLLTSGNGVTTLARANEVYRDGIRQAIERGQLKVSERDSLAGIDMCPIGVNGRFTCDGGVVYAYSLAGDDDAGVRIVQDGVVTARYGGVRVGTSTGADTTTRRLVRLREDLQQGVVEKTMAMDAGAWSFSYSVVVSVNDDGVGVAVHLDEPLPDALRGRATFDLELPSSAVLGKTWALGGSTGPFGITGSDSVGIASFSPLGVGRVLTISGDELWPDLTVTSWKSDLHLLDARQSDGQGDRQRTGQDDVSGPYIIRSVIGVGPSNAAMSWTIRTDREPQRGTVQ